jgi:hypothetical protein
MDLHRILLVVFACSEGASRLTCIEAQVSCRTPTSCAQIADNICATTNLPGYRSIPGPVQDTQSTSFPRDASDILHEHLVIEYVRTEKKKKYLMESSIHPGSAGSVIGFAVSALPCVQLQLLASFSW